jgi:hypothetical protein
MVGKMVHRYVFVGAALVLALGLDTSRAAGPPRDSLGDAEFTRIHGLLKPRDGESKWLDTIDWMPTLHEARQKAAAEGKLLFLLEAGGPPLGFC